VCARLNNIKSDDVGIAYKISVKKPEGKHSMEDVGIDGKHNQMDL